MSIQQLLYPASPCEYRVMVRLRICLIPCGVDDRNNSGNGSDCSGYHDPPPPRGLLCSRDVTLRSRAGLLRTSTGHREGITSTRRTKESLARATLVTDPRGCPGPRSVGYVIHSYIPAGSDLNIFENPYVPVQNMYRYENIMSGYRTGPYSSPEATAKTRFLPSRPGEVSRADYAGGGKDIGATRHNLPFISQLSCLLTSPGRLASESFQICVTDVSHVWKLFLRSGASEIHHLEIDRMFLVMSHRVVLPFLPVHATLPQVGCWSDACLSNI